MEVTVKFFATLREGRGKITTYVTEDSVTTKDILDYYEINVEDVSILYVNGLDAALDKKLEHGDIVSIFPPVGGG